MAFYDEVFIGGLNKVPLTYASNLVGKGFLMLERPLFELTPVLIGVDIAFGNRDMLNHRGAEHDVERLVVERKPPTFWQQDRVKPALGGFLQRMWVYIGNPDVPMFGQDSGDVRTVAPAQVKHLVFWRHRQKATKQFAPLCARLPRCV
jgi:hypothetical protein